jgi:hypothetical protein
MRKQTNGLFTPTLLFGTCVLFLVVLVSDFFFDQQFSDKINIKQDSFICFKKTKKKSKTKKKGESG